MPSCSWFEITSACAVIHSDEHTLYSQIYVHKNIYFVKKKIYGYTTVYTARLSDKTALHQRSLLTSLRPVKSRSKILLLLMPAGSPVNTAACAYTLCLIEQARTVMADKERHFISGSSLILMKTSHLWGHADISQAAVTLYCTSRDRCCFTAAFQSSFCPCCWWQQIIPGGLFDMHI